MSNSSIIYLTRSLPIIHRSRVSYILSELRPPRTPKPKWMNYSTRFVCYVQLPQPQTLIGHV